MHPDGSSTLDAATRAQLRLRLRRWLGLLAPDAPRRSPLRARTLQMAAGALADGPAGRARRRAITGALFAALHDVALHDAALHDAALHDAALQADDPFAAAARAWAAGAPGPATPELVAGWDAILTAVELRPASVGPDDVPRLLDRVMAAQADHFARTRWSQGARDAVAAAGDVGPWLRRQGARDVDTAVAHLWSSLEPALIEVAPPAERQGRVRQGMENLLDWDARVARIAAEVTRARGADAGQATAARLLEPRLMRAWLTLPFDDLLRLGMTCGRNLALATFTGPGSVEPPMSARVASPALDPEAAAVARARWQAFFEGLTRALDGGRLDPRQAVFLWLSAGVGAGEAWRLTGGAPEKVGSANYARNKALDALRAAVAGVPQRLDNPGAPDPRTRSVAGQLAMREAPDPSAEAEAGVPADAREQAPPLDDRALLGLMYVLNLGPEAVRLLPAGWPRPDPAALLTRALCHGAWARDRRAVVRSRLHAAGAVHGWPAVHDLLLLLGAATAGSSVDAARWCDERFDGGDPGVIERWLAAEGPAHEAIARLRGVDRRQLPPPEAPLPRRPVEREARLRMHLRAVTRGPR